jgi:hypothetical protein
MLMMTVSERRCKRDRVDSVFLVVVVVFVVVVVGCCSCRNRCFCLCLKEMD